MIVELEVELAASAGGALQRQRRSSSTAREFCETDSLASVRRSVDACAPFPQQPVLLGHAGQGFADKRIVPMEAYP